MSLWARILLLVVLPAYIMLGCERDDLTIGLPPKDNNFQLGYYEHTFSPMNMVEDSVVNQGSGRLLAGQFSDPIFGDMYTIAYSTIDAASSSPQAEEGATADSLVLRTKVDYIYGNTDITLDLKIWELTTSLIDTVIYKSSDEQPITFTDPIGTINYNFPVGQFEEESTILVETFLDLTFADRLLDSLELNTGGYPTDSTFKRVFKGIAIIPEAGSDGIIGIDLTDPETELVLYYTDANGDPETWTMRFNDAENYSYMIPNGTETGRIGTALEPFTSTHVDFETADEYIYYQSGTGLGITLDATDLLALADTLQNTIISTAVLEIEDVEYSLLNAVPSVLRVLLIDDSNEPLYYNGSVLRTLYQGSRSDSTDLSAIGFSQNAQEEFLQYSSERKIYQADVTLYLQGFLEGRVDLTKLWIYDPRIASNVNRFRTLKDNVKFKIYYTKSK